MGHKNTYGCLMASITPVVGQNIIKYGKQMVPDSHLYTCDDDDYGRDYEPHVTLKFGFVDELTDDEIKYIIGNTKSFNVIAEGVSCFENELFDVVKFDIKLQDPLISMRKRCDEFKNEDSYPNYHPHLTIAYIKKGKFPHVIKNKNLNFKVDRIKYSGKSESDKRYYKI